MKIKWPQPSERGFFTLLGLLLALAIIFFLCYAMLNTYSKSTVLGSKIGRSLLKQQTKSSGHRAALDGTLLSTGEEIRGLKGKLQEREKKMRIRR